VPVTTPGMQLQLFGLFALTEKGQRTTPISLRKAQAMLAHLALKESRSETREALLDLLWAATRASRSAGQPVKQALVRAGWA
jgi:DNA-binding SARP family transcriptional activator